MPPPVFAGRGPCLVPRLALCFPREDPPPPEQCLRRSPPQEQGLLGSSASATAAHSPALPDVVLDALRRHLPFAKLSLPGNSSGIRTAGQTQGFPVGKVFCCS